MDVPVMDAEQLVYYARLCGWALARAHARTGPGHADQRATWAPRETFDHAIAEFAVAYAEQNERTTSGLVDAVASGRVHAMTGRLGPA